MKNLKSIYEQVRQAGRQKTLLDEEVTRKELAPMLDSFVSFASEKLGLKSLPNIRYKDESDDYNSFAAYSPVSNELSICTMNRHPMDIFRSVAHELVHHKQNEDGRLGKDIAKEGETGSDIENEANAEAGKIMRWFARANPSMFSKSYVIEDHAANHSSGGEIRGMGYVTGDSSPTVTSNYLIQNIADTEKMKSNHTNNLWQGQIRDWMDDEEEEEYKSKQLAEGINDPAKLKAVFLAGGPGSGKDFVMKRSLTGHGLREINSDKALEHLMRRGGLDFEMPESEKNEREKLLGRAREIRKATERSTLAGRQGHIINGTAESVDHIQSIKDRLEGLGYETMMVFVDTSNEVSKLRNRARGKKGERKVPDGTDKSGMPDGSKDIRQWKWSAAQENKETFRKLFGDNKFTTIDNTADYNKATPEDREKLDGHFDRVRNMVSQFAQGPVKTPEGQQWVKSETQKRGITKFVPPKTVLSPQADRSVESPKAYLRPPAEQMMQARRYGMSYYGNNQFGRNIGGKREVFVQKNGKFQRNISEDLRKWFSKTHPEGDWKRINSKGEAIGPCAREPGEPKPKCMSKKKRAQLSKKERASAVSAKRKHDPNPERKGQPINVSNFGKGKLTKEETMRYLEEKNVPTNPGLWSKAKSLAKSKFDVYPSAYANGWASKWYKSKGGGWKAVNEERGSCWDGYKMEGMKKKGDRMVPNCVPVNEDINENFEDYIKISSNREVGSNSLAMIYKTMTPGQEPNAEVPDARKRKKLAQEDAGLPKGAFDLASMNDGLGPTFSLRASPALVTGFSQIGSALAEAAPSIRKWALKENTQRKFFEKYGEAALTKLLEACERLQEAGCGCEHSGTKSIRKLRESFDKGIMDIKPIGIGMYRPHIEVDEDWQKVNRKDKTDGLSQAAVDAYRRENPGSKLQTAVTEKKPTGKRKKRRINFCRRMKGMKKRLTSAETARDPDSDINKALRRWNCEE